MNEDQFKDRLKKLRKQSGISQTELSEKINVSKGLISLYESGKKLPSRDTLQSIADVFNVTIDYLAGRESGSIYYFEPEVANLAEIIKSSPLRKKVCELSRQMSDEDLAHLIYIMEKIIRIESASEK